MKRTPTILLLLCLLGLFLCYSSVADDELICPVCGFKNPVGNKFCNKCGHRFLNGLAQHVGQQAAATVKEIDGDQLLLDRGEEDGIEIGQHYQIFEIERCILDESTGDTLQLVTVPAVKMRVVNVMNNVSYAEYNIVGDSQPSVGDEVFFYDVKPEPVCGISLSIGAHSIQQISTESEAVQPYYRATEPAFAAEFDLIGRFVEISLGYVRGRQKLDHVVSQIQSHEYDGYRSSTSTFSTYGIWLRLNLRLSSRFSIVPSVGAGMASSVSDGVELEYGTMTVRHEGGFFVGPGLDFRLKTSRVVDLFVHFDARRVLPAATVIEFVGERPSERILFEENGSYWAPNVGVGLRYNILKTDKF